MKKVLFLAVFDDPEGKRHSKLYNICDNYYRDTFSPLCNLIGIIDFTSIKGRSYKERKANLEQKAIEFSYLLPECYNLSWGEISVISDWFEDQGRKYGLLTEFRENAIC